MVGTEKMRHSVVSIVRRTEQRRVRWSMLSVGALSKFLLQVALYLLVIAIGASEFATIVRSNKSVHSPNEE